MFSFSQIYQNNLCDVLENVVLKLWVMCMYWVMCREEWKWAFLYWFMVNGGICVWCGHTRRPIKHNKIKGIITKAKYYPVYINDWFLEYLANKKLICAMDLLFAKYNNMNVSYSYWAHANGEMNAKCCRWEIKREEMVCKREE